MSDIRDHDADLAIVLADESFADSLGINIEAVLLREWANRIKYLPGHLIPPRPTLEQLRAIFK